MWQNSDEQPDVFLFLASHERLSPEEVVEICAIDQMNRWHSGREFPVERYFESLATVRLDKRLKLGLVQDEFQCQSERGLSPDVDSFVKRFPELAEILPALLPVGNLPTVERRQEAIRGEGHLVDGRSDIFSLGIVFYELLAGRRPFQQNRLEHMRAIADALFAAIQEDARSRK